MYAYFYYSSVDRYVKFAFMYRELMTQYDRWNPDRNARPVMESAVWVVFGMSLQDVLNMDENSVATLVLWDNYEWKDPTLAWNESQYPSNPKSLRVDLDNI